MELRNQSLRGGAYLTVREAFGMLIRIGGAVIFTRVIGAAEFGILAGSQAIIFVLSLVAQMGVEVSIIRRQDEPDQRAIDAAFSLVAVNGAIAVAMGLVGAGVALGIGVGGHAVAVFAVLLLSLPINIMWAPAQGQIERNFGFRSMAFLELTGDAILYSVSVVLVLVGMGVWGPVIGVFAWQTWLFVSSYRVARIRPRWSWDREEIAHYRKFGRGFSLAVAADRSKDLVNPLVVGALAGSAAVGNVFLVLRLLESMGFVFRATWRLSLAALNRVRHDMTRFRRGIEEGMALQVLIVGPILAVACFAVGEVIPFVWGDEYPDAAEIFPLVAVATLSTGVTSMLVNALYSLGRTGAVLRANLVRAAFCAGFAALAVERNGVTGYGVGEIAGLISIVVLDGALRRELDFSYRRVLPWYGAFLPLIGITALPVMWRPVLLVPLMVMLLWPRTRGELVGYVRTVLASRTRAGTDDVDDDVADDGTDDGADSRDTADVAERELIAINGSAPMVTVASDPFVSAVTANATNWAEVASTAAERRNGPVILDAATAADGARSSNGAHHPHPTEARPVPTAKSPSSRNTARPSVDGRDVIFVAWTGRPARTHEIAQALGAEAKILPGHRTIKPLVPFRYLFQAFQTLFFLIRRRPDVVLVQNPPVVAAAVVCFYGRFSRCRVILDSHPGGFGAQGDRVSARLQWMHRWAVRHSSGVMVTTRDWVQLVNAWGGRGIVVHEPPPRFDVDAPTERPGRGRVLYVTVFAPDEPLIEVLEAARSLPDVEFVVTGDQRRCPSKIREQAPENVVFVGYLRGDDYVRALADADMVLALTSEPTSVMRAAYEAVYANRPLLVTDWPALRETFPLAVPVRNTADSIAEAVADTLDEYDSQLMLLREARRLQEQRWSDQLDDLRQVIHAPEPISAFRRRSFLRRQPFLRRRAWVIALTGLLAFGMATLQADNDVVDYTAEATLLVQSGASDEGPGQAFEATRLALSYVTVIERDQVIRRHVAANINVTESTVEDNLGIATKGDSSALKLTYTASNPETALEAVALAVEVITAQNGYATAPIPAGSVVQVELDPTPTESGGKLFTPINSLIIGLFLGLILAVIWERNDARVDSAEQLIGLVPAPVSDASVTGPAPALLRRWVVGFTGTLAKVGLVASPPGQMSSTAWVADWLASAYPEIFPALGSPFSSRVVQVEPQDAKPKSSRSRSSAREPLDVELIAAGTVTGGENGEAAALESTFLVLVVPTGTRTAHVTRSVRTLRQLGVEVGWTVLAPPSRLRRRLVPPLSLLRGRTRLMHERAGEPDVIRVTE